MLSDRRIELDASFIHDTFLSMVEALLAACEGQREVEWVYFHEPSSTHVRLACAVDRTEIALTRYPDFRMPRPKFGAEGTLIGKAEVRLRDLTGDVIIAGTRMLELHGEDGYARSWRHSFPSRQINQLKQLRRNLTT